MWIFLWLNTRILVAVDSMALGLVGVWGFRFMWGNLGSLLWPLGILFLYFGSLQGESPLDFRDDNLKLASRVWFRHLRCSNNGLGFCLWHFGTFSFQLGILLLGLRLAFSLCKA
jgi:hypothetical protein